MFVDVYTSCICKVSDAICDINILLKTDEEGQKKKIEQRQACLQYVDSARLKFIAEKLVIVRH